MKLYQADSGQEIEIESSNFTEIQSHIKDVADIEPHQQILLTELGLEVKDGTIQYEELYLYNKNLDSNGSNHLQHSIEIEPPVPMSTITEVNLSESNENFETFRESYLLSFLSHVKYGQNLFEIAQKHTNTCERLLNEQIRQQKAMTAGLINLKTHSNKTIKIFNEYHSKAQKLFADQKTLINSVPEDLDSLQKIPIHVAFALDQKTLGDFIKPEQMLIYQKHCQNTREFLLSNTQQLLNNVQDLKVAFGSEELSELKFDDKLQNELKEIQKVCEKVIQKQQILMRDLTRVESLFTEINQDLDDQESRSKYEAIAHLYKIHYEEYIPEITKYDRFLRDSVLNFTDSKTQMNATVKQRLLDIAYYESISKSIIYNVDGLEDALQEQAPKYKYLKIHYRFGPSWAALLVEIVRRKEFNAFSINVTKEMARVLDELRQKEERIRGRFRENYCNDLWYPHVSGINDGPPVCRFHIKCPDDQLPDITMEEVDLFEKAFAMKEGNGIGFSQRMYKKLQEIRPDLEKTAVNFDNILKRSSLFERIRSLEKENQELKQKVSQKPEGNSIILAPSIHRESSRDRNSIRDSRERKESFKKDETIKAYELRIKSLEQIIHDKFHKESENEIEELRQENRDLVEHLQIEEQKVKETDRDIVEIGQKLNEITQEMKNQKLKSTQIENNFTKVLIEVFEHLDFCSSIVRNESIEKCVYKDVDFLNLRTKMKDVEDLLSNQMNGSKQSMHTESLNLVNEMVELISKVEDLEEQVLELNGELTETQANEAILEADLNSFKVLLDRTSKAFLQEKERADMLDRENLDLRETNKKLKEELSDIRLEIDHISLELVTEKGKVGEYSAENGEIKILNAELIVSLSEVRLEQEHTQHELAEEREISEAREVENQESKEYSERLEIEISQLKFEVESINRLLQDEKTKMTLTGTENAKLKAVNSQLNNQINETKAKVQQLNQELNAEKSKSQTLTAQLTESTTNFIPTELKLLEKSKKILQNWLIISNHSLQKLITIHNLSNPVIEDHHYEITNENYAEYLSQTIACQKQTYNTITGLQFDLNVKISFNKYFLLISFKIGSVCLFLPTKTLGIIAFHINCPGYYLDVTEKFKQRAKKREWIIGVIERIEERVGDGIEVEMGKRYYLCDAKPFRE